MKITFQCTYRGKPTGYEEKSFGENKELYNDFIEDIGRTFISRHLTPTQSLILYLDSNSRLSLLISSMGATVPTWDDTASPWKFPTDSRIASLCMVEEKEDDRNTIYSIFIDFCLNYKNNADKLLDMIELNPDDLDHQYNINYDEFYKTFVTGIQQLNCPELKLPPKSIVLLYCPFYSYDKKKKQYAVDELNSAGIFIEKRRIINIPETYSGVMKNTLFNYIITMINLLFKK